ncbi:DUF333 domain-containing protein [Candidatus Pacearchaeota archaeon]|nr:DUF333 domain-containing protein [Candidatus Pacearchaeota archaeon]
MKRENKLIVGVMFVLIILIVLIVLSYFNFFGKNKEDNKDVSNVVDPSAIYCKELGYKYEIRTKENGQYGSCIISSNLECDSWDFFNGKCAQQFTFCEKNEGEIITVRESCQFSSECGECILSNGDRCKEWNYIQGKC